MDAEIDANKVRKLQKDNVVLRDMSELCDKLRTFRQDGPKKIQVLADFDGTLTNFIMGLKEKTNLTSIDIFAKTKSLSQSFHDTFTDLWTRTKADINNLEIPEDQKELIIDQAYSEIETMLTKEKVTLEDIQEATEDCNFPLKEGYETMFSLLSDLGIPLTVVTAGTGEVVAYMLREFKPTVVGNFLKFDDSGKVLGFMDRAVHSCNKHSTPLPENKGRHNIVLLGDAVEDCRIGENLEGTKTVLKIGFFVGGDDSRLQKYLSHYDIVLKDDPTMDTVTAVLKLIASSK